MKLKHGKGRGRGKDHKRRSTIGYSSAFRLVAIADQLASTTHFTLEECKCLLYMYQRMRAYGPFDRLRMREILHVIFEITDAIMLDFAFKAFDRDMDGEVSEFEWVQGLSTMLRGTTDELSEWCYFMYDINGDGGLAREELAHCLKGCILPGWGVDTDEIETCEREIVEIAMNKLDYDRDGQITIGDFKKACRKDPLLLVSVGPALPPLKSCATFLALITEKFHSYTGPVGRVGKQERKSDRKTVYSASGHRPSPSSSSNFSPTSSTFMDSLWSKGAFTDSLTNIF